MVGHLLLLNYRIMENFISPKIYYNVSAGVYKQYAYSKELSCSGCEETDTVNIINM